MTIGYAEINNVEYTVQMKKGYIYLINEQLKDKQKYKTFDLLKQKLMSLKSGGNKVKIWFTIGK